MVGRLCFVLAFAASVAGEPAQATTAERLLLLERGPRDVLVADAATGAVIQTIPLAVEPEQMFATPDGRRVVILNRVSNGPASMTILDAAAPKVLGTVEVGWGVPDETTGRTTNAFGTFAENHCWGPAGTILLDDGTRLLVISPGAGTSHPAELVLVDLDHAAIVGRVPSPVRGMSQVGSTTSRSSFITNRSDSPRAVAFNPARQLDADSLPAELTFIDLTKPEIAGSVRLAGKPSRLVWPRGSELVYVLEPAGTPEKAGHLHLITATDRSIKRSLDVTGATALSMTHDGELFLLGPASVADPDGTASHGQIRALHGDALGDPVSVLPEPLAVMSAPDHTRLAVLCAHGVSIIDRESQRVTGNVSLDRQLVKFMFIEGGKRALALLYDPGSQVGSLAILDLVRAQPVTTIQTGSAGKAFLLSVLGGVAAGSVGAMGNPTNPGLGRFSAETRYLSQWAASQSANLVVSPDERHAWVLNTSTQDLFNVDLETGLIAGKTGTPANPTLHQFNNLLLLPEISECTVLDASTGKKLARTFTMSGVYMSVVLSPGGAHIGVMFNNAVFILDGTTGSQIAKVPGKRLAGALFVPVAAR